MQMIMKILKICILTNDYRDKLFKKWKDVKFYYKNGGS